MVDPIVPPFPRPADKPLSWLGLLSAYRKDVLPTWPYTAYQSEIYTSSFLGRPTLLLNEPEAIRRVLVDNAGNYTRTPATIRILKPLLGDGLFLAEGEAWKHQRKRLSPPFASRAIPAFAHHAAVVTDAMIRDLVAANTLSDVDLLAVSQHLTLEVAARGFLSMPLGAKREDIRRLVTEYAARLARPRLLDFILPVSVPSPRDLARRRFRRRWFAELDALIVERSVRRRDPPVDVFDHIVACHGDDADASKAVRDQVATMLIAGHETTAVTLFWALYLLTLDPRSQARVAGEARAANFDSDGGADVLAGLVFTKAVIEESLRLYPPAFLIIRLARAADVVDGRAIAPGTVIMIAPWVLHRHRDLWKSPDAFDPGRFLPMKDPPDRFAFLPFGTGPRVCIGAGFAVAEATVALAKIVGAFAISLSEEREVRPTSFITTQPSPIPGFALRPRH